MIVKILADGLKARFIQFAKVFFKLLYGIRTIERLFIVMFDRFAAPVGLSSHMLAHVPRLYLLPVPAIYRFGHSFVPYSHPG